MTVLSFRDPRSDPAGWAGRLGISREAVELYLDSSVIDLHIDSFIWTRVFGYDLCKRHGEGLLGASFYSQVDFPRTLEARLAGAIWVITTNPCRTARGRARAFFDNLQRLRHVFGTVSEQFALVKNAAEFRAARQNGKHAAFLGIQGGNAIDESLDHLDALANTELIRITLVHLSNSRIGSTSAPWPWQRDRGLSDFGRDYVKKLNEHRILVDLAHINRRGFFDALAVHDRSQPIIVTHTGVMGAHQHWRNIDDEQLRAVADRGGTVGVMYQANFLGDPLWKGRAASVVRHLEHIVRTVGEDHASLGSDWDGAIVTPRDMRTCLELPKLVQLMLDRGWRAERIQKILGSNFLRVVEAIRG